MGVSCSSHPTREVVNDQHPTTSNKQDNSTAQVDDNCNIQPQLSPLQRVPELATSAPTDATPIHISVNLEQRPKSATGPQIRRRRSAPRENNWQSVLVAPNEKSTKKKSVVPRRRGGSPTHFPDGVPFAPLHLMQRTSILSDQGTSSSNATTPEHVNHRTQPYGYTSYESFRGVIRSHSILNEGVGCGGGNNNRSVTFIIEDENFHQNLRIHPELDAFSDD